MDKNVFELRSKIRDYVNKNIKPFTNEFDKQQSLPEHLFKDLSELGILGATIPLAYGGQEYDNCTQLVIHEELGKAYSSLQNYVAVICMFCKPLKIYGTDDQKEKWLKPIASGDIVPALALTEPNVGSDIKLIETNVSDKGDYYLLNGKKKYITLGQIADVYMVAAKCEGRGVVLLVERNTEGLYIQPINDLLGLRANKLAELSFNNCKIPVQNRLGKVGFGLTHVISFALDEGRFATACGSVGLAQACLEESIHYTNERLQFGVLIKEHQLVAKMLTEIIVKTKAARELCRSVAKNRDDAEPAAVNNTLIAKYFASKAAVEIANNAVQIQGAFGCTSYSSVQRLYRDAKIMEIIEGTSQIHEIYIPKSFNINNNF